MDDPFENGEDVVVRFQTLFKLNVLIPERMGQEVQSNTICSTFKQSIRKRSVLKALKTGMDWLQTREGGREHLDTELESPSCSEIACAARK